MGIKESLEKQIGDGRSAIAILLVAVLWRGVISLDSKITVRESLPSGLALILLGWLLFAYAYRRSKELKGWIISNYIYQGIAVILVIINAHALIYYGMRWYKLLYVSSPYPPLDFLFRDVLYISLVAFYCAILWIARYPKEMHKEYLAKSKEKTILHIISPYLYQRGKRLKEMSMKELIGTVITDERTLLVIVGLAFIWRIAISLDYTVTLGESMASGIALIIVGWLFFAYIAALPRKQQGWGALVKVYHGIALGILAINLYVLVYYSMSWYGGASSALEVVVPLDYLFNDARFLALVMFYCASIVLSRFLKRAYEEYTLLAAEGSKPSGKQGALRQTA